MTAFDPRDPALLRWLAGLAAKHELVMRMAMRQVFDDARGDPAWSARIDALMPEIDPDERELALLLEQAEMAAEMIQSIEDAAIVSGSVRKGGSAP